MRSAGGESSELFPSLVLALNDLPADTAIGASDGLGVTLKALLAELPGRRGAARDAGAVDSVLHLLQNGQTDDASGVVAPSLLLLAQLVDDPELSAARAADAATAAVSAMRTFPEHREVQAAGANVIFVCAAEHASACADAGAEEALSQAAALKHFAALEVGQRHPFRFKLGIVEAALRRVNKTP